MRARILRTHEGLLSTGETVRYEAGTIVEELPLSLHQWIPMGIAEWVPDAEARETKVVAPKQTKPVKPTAKKRR